MATLDEHSKNSGYMQPIQLTLYLLLLLAAIVGNGLLIFLFARHRSLRTVHNMLIAELSVIDLINSVITIPLSICYIVLDTPSSRGKTFSWIVSFLHSLFVLLSLSTMSVQAIDRFLAIRFPVFYKTRKSRKKVLAIILAKWLLNIALTTFTYMPLYKIDIGNSPVLVYREVYARESGHKLSRYVLSVYCLMCVIFGGLSLTAVKSNVVQNELSRKVRRKAVRTILLVMVLTLVCYIPAVIKSAVYLGLKNDARVWLVFLIMYFMSIPGAVNPFLFLTRVERFQKKLKMLRNVMFRANIEESDDHSSSEAAGHEEGAAQERQGNEASVMYNDHAVVVCPPSVSGTGSVPTQHEQQMTEFIGNRTN